MTKLGLPLEDAPARSFERRSRCERGCNGGPIRLISVLVVVALASFGLAFGLLAQSAASGTVASHHRSASHRPYDFASIFRERVSNNETGLERFTTQISKPPDSTSSLPVLAAYFIALRKWDPSGAPSLPDDAFEAILPKDLPIDMADPNTTEGIRGIWCGPWHPSGLACFSPYEARKPWGSGLARRLSAGNADRAEGFMSHWPAQGFKPGHVFFYDTPGNRNTLEFFTRFEMEFQFPNWAGGVKPGLPSGIPTYMEAPFDLLPYPAAVYEGLPPGHKNILGMRKVTGNLLWDDDAAKDPALCFCSVTFIEEDVIQRNNFGKSAYRVYRVMDADGQKTKYWKNFTQWAGDRKLVKISRKDLFPDMTCTGWCPIAVAFQVLFVMGTIFQCFFLCCCCCCPVCGVSWVQYAILNKLKPKSVAQDPNRSTEVEMTRAL